MRHTTTHYIVLAGLVVALGLIGCRKSDTAEQADSGPTRFVSLAVGNGTTSGEMVRSTHFRPGDGIAIAIALAGSEPVELTTALFYMNNGQRMNQQTRSVTRPGTPEMFVYKPSKAWSVGRYLVEVKVDGRVAAQQEIEVSQ